MTNKIFTILAIFLSLAIFKTNLVYASPTEPTIEITSFERVGDVNSQIGEVCGVVKNMTGEAINLSVIADYNTHNPAEYHTFAGTSGYFCQLIRTFGGEVEVTVLNSEKTKSAKKTAALKLH